MGFGSILGAPVTFGLSKWLSPTPGAAEVGSKPQPTTMPNPYQNLMKVYGGLPGQNAALSTDITSELGGRLSPSTVNSIQDYASRMGMTQTGTTRAPFNLYGGAADIGKTVEQLQNQGISNYNATMPTIYNTQTLSPQLQAMIDTYNKQIAAAPDPVAAAKYTMDLFNAMALSQGVGSGVSSLASMYGPGMLGGGPAGGTGSSNAGFLSGLL